MSDWMEKYERERKEKMTKAKEYLLSLLPALKTAKVTELVVHYDGSGDEGSIQSINAYSDKERQIKIDVSTLNDQEIDEAACDILSGQGIDWYNNEGGYGFVVLTVKTKKITIEHNTRFESSKYSEYEA